ncbi:MAG: hypothetical protein RMX68_013145 [Aulosira sp. ZfuVER01]|nr:hypothetical protein [Aulosira sp. ZfuVER01]MDZ8001093.1 hypothetical protein [Aulosira sp. DedVER01a]MDZ8053203.1 hypothetical protein [Aulosira sp. ZfuCHP01]
MRSNTNNQIATNSDSVGFMSHNDASFNTAVGFSSIMIAIILLTSINAYKKYRAAVLRREIASLEKV